MRVPSNAAHTAKVHEKIERRARGAVPTERVQRAVTAAMKTTCNRALADFFLLVTGVAFATDKGKKA